MPILSIVVRVLKVEVRVRTVEAVAQNVAVNESVKARIKGVVVAAATVVVAAKERVVVKVFEAKLQRLKWYSQHHAL
jgi:NADH/NAD ratio-sensing transcriptional regulator Rex